MHSKGTTEVPVHAMMSLLLYVDIIGSFFIFLTSYCLFNIVVFIELLPLIINGRNNGSYGRHGVTKQALKETVQPRVAAGWVMQSRVPRIVNSFL